MCTLFSAACNSFLPLSQIGRMYLNLESKKILDTFITHRDKKECYSQARLYELDCPGAPLASLLRLILLLYLVYCG